MTKIPDNFKNMFDKPPRKQKRFRRIAITISPKYVSFSSGVYMTFDYAPYVIFTTDESKPKTLFVFPSQKKEQGAFRIVDTKNEKAVKIYQPSVASNLAQLLGLDNSNTTWRVYGEYDEKNGCIVFKGKDAEEAK